MLFSTRGLLLDANGDGLPDGARARVVVDETASAGEVAAAAEIAARLGLETMALDLPVGTLASELESLPGGMVEVRVGVSPGEIPAGADPADGSRGEPPDHERGWVEAGTSPLGHPLVVVSGGSAAAVRRAARALATWLTWPDETGTTPLAGAAGGGRVARVEVGPAGDALVRVESRRGEIARVRLHPSEPPVTGGLPSAEPPTRTAGEPAGERTASGVGWGLGSVLDLERTGRDAVRRVGEFPGLLADTDSDWLPDDCRAVLVLDPQAGGRALVGAIDVAARLGLESTGLTWPVAVVGGEEVPPGRIPVRIGSQTGEAESSGVLRAETGPAGAFLAVEGGGAAGLRRACRHLAESMPRVGSEGGPTYRDLEVAAEEILAGRSPAGQAADAVRLLNDDRGLAGARVVLEEPDPELEAVLGAAGRAVEVVDRRQTRTEVEFTWDAPWEVPRFWELYRARVRPLLPDLAALGPVHVEVGLSEPAEILDAVAVSLRQDLDSLGLEAPRGDAWCLCAYKPGLSWLRRVVLPALAGQEVTRLGLTFAPFEPPDPVGAPRWYELRTRWLQEAYPAREVVARALDLNPEQVVLSWGTADGPAYRVEALGPDGPTVLAAEFTPPVREVPYVRAFPARGLVHPTTGWIRVLQAGRVVLEETFPTDREVFWSFYQEYVLPEVFRRVRAWTGGQPGPAHQPLFARLRVDVTMSEPDDEALGVRHERLSALEALHEDLYFVTLDAFGFLGEESGGEPLRAPGLVEPWVHSGPPGEPRATITLERWPYPRPCLARPDGALKPLAETAPVPPGAVRATEVVLDDVAGRPATVTLRALTHDHETFLVWRGRAQALEDLQVAGAYRGALALAGSEVRLILEGPAEQAAFAFAATGPALSPAGPAAPGAAAGAATSVVPMDHVLSWEEAAAIGRRLAERHPEVSYRQAGRTFWGRPVGALEVRLPAAGRLVSQAKAAGWKLVFLVQARHHANEVSATNAALRLAEMLAADPSWRAALARLNVVIVPVANVDGASLGHALQAEHPRWMHHAARYNGCGLEFSREYFNADTAYPEALVLPGLWARWLPDLVVDDHGYPNHEWVQPFAGYGPPGFPSFWIPRGLFYGIVQHPPDAEAAREFAARVRDAVIEALNADSGIRAASAGWIEAFRTYGTAWLPDVFPLSEDRGMVFYFGPWAPEHPWRGLHRRFPRVTALAWTTEVADETVQGGDLAEAARAHLLADLAQVRLLADLDPGLRRRRFQGPGGLRLAIGRPRPLWAALGGSETEPE